MESTSGAGTNAARYPIPAALADAAYCTEILVRRSRFLAAAAHAPDMAAARAFVEAQRRRHAGATHNCWACVAGPPGDTARIGASDDGEPHGTAGRPMLNVLLYCGIGEICVVVTRWFGGIKLGTGGLVRAYQDAVRENLAGLLLTERAPVVCCAVNLTYAHLDGFYRLLPRFDARVLAQEHGTGAVFRLELPEAQSADFAAALAGLTNGSAFLQMLSRDK